jgi:HSP20 family protein
MLDLKSLIPWGQKSNVPVKNETVSDPFVSFRREVDRLFDDFFNGAGAGTFPAPRNGGWTASLPSLDVTDSDKELVVSAELPGMSERDFEVSLVGDVLTIKGEKKHEHEEKQGERHYVERSYGSFSRAVRLPFDASEQDVNADYDKGVLAIRIPKPADVQSKVKQIEVKAT